jgi:hypothetical protein
MLGIYLFICLMCFNILLSNRLTAKGRYFSTTAQSHTPTLSVDGRILPRGAFESVVGCIDDTTIQPIIRLRCLPQYLTVSATRIAERTIGAEKPKIIWIRGCHPSRVLLGPCSSMEISSTMQECKRVTCSAQTFLK